MGVAQVGGRGQVGEKNKKNPKFGQNLAKNVDFKGNLGCEGEANGRGHAGGRGPGGRGLRVTPTPPKPLQIWVKSKNSAFLRRFLVFSSSGHKGAPQEGILGRIRRFWG